MNKKSIYYKIHFFDRVNFTIPEVNYLCTVLQWSVCDNNS